MVIELIPDVYDITVQEGNGRYRAFLMDGDVPTLVDCGLADTIDTLAAGVDGAVRKHEWIVGRAVQFDFDAALLYHGSSDTEDAVAKLDAFVNFANKPE